MHAKCLHLTQASGDSPMCSSSIMLPPFCGHSLLHICICLCPCSPCRSCYPWRLLRSYIYTFFQKAFLNCTRVYPSVFVILKSFRGVINHECYPCSHSLAVLCKFPFWGSGSLGAVIRAVPRMVLPIPRSLRGACLATAKSCWLAAGSAIYLFLHFLSGYVAHQKS